MTAIFAQDIGRWAADIAQDDYSVAPTISNSRRFSFNTSLNSDSPALSATSRQSSASSQTSASAHSFTASDLNADLDADTISYYSLQQDSEQSWRDILTSSTLNPAHKNLPTTEQVVSCKAPIHTTSIYVASSAPGGINENAVSLGNHRSRLGNLPQYVPTVAPRLSASEVHSSSSSTVQHAHARAQVSHQQASAQDLLRRTSRVVNPRRSSAGPCWSRPALVRQVGRREDFVMHLVESAAQLVSYIWPALNFTSSHTAQWPNNTVITLSFFIQETLKRSRSTYSTLQVTLFYLYLLKSSGAMLKPETCLASHAPSTRALGCGRRMFLAALILASKYLQDRNYSAKAWSKITSLPVHEINVNERAFLSAVGYNLHLPLEKYNYWCSRGRECVEAVKIGGFCPWADVLAAMGAEEVRVTSLSTSHHSHGFGYGLPIAAGSEAPDHNNSHVCDKTGTPLPYLTVLAPPSPTLSRDLTSPTVSPWIVNSFTPAASIADNTNDSKRSLLSQSSDPLRRALARRPAMIGHSMAHELAGKANLATLQSAQDPKAMCMEQVDSGTSSKVGQPPIRRSRSCNDRVRLISRLSTTSCHLPSPLRTGVTQLPTPPISIGSMSSVITAPLDSPSYLSEILQESTTSTSASVPLHLVARVAQCAEAHGLDPSYHASDSTNLTLPPIKLSATYDGFSEASSEMNSNMSWQSSPSFEGDGAGRNGNLPALAHVLRCGLREHLKPYVQQLRHASPSPSEHHVRGTKRGCDEEVDGERLVKVQRAATL